LITGFEATTRALYVLYPNIEKSISTTYNHEAKFDNTTFKINQKSTVQCIS